MIRACLTLALIILFSRSLVLSQQSGGKPVTSEQMASEVSSMLAAGDTAALLKLAAGYERSIYNVSDSSLKADLYYFSGVCYLIGENYSRALSNLFSVVRIKKNLGKTDDRYLKSLYNIGVAYNAIGDFGYSSQFLTEFIEEGKKFYGKDSQEVVSAYSALIGSLIEEKAYDEVKSSTTDVLELLKNNWNVLTFHELGNLYHNIGVGYARNADYAKAKVYLEISLGYYKKANLPIDQNYINLINNLAIVYGNLGEDDMETEFFKEGISLAVSNNSYLSFNLINTYAIELGNEGKADKGEKLLADIVGKAKNLYGTNSRYYINVLVNYAEYIRDYLDEADKAIPLFRECLDYSKNHPEDIVLHEPVIIGYSLALSRKGQPEEALELLQTLLFNDTESEGAKNLFENPPLTSMQMDARNIKILRSKHTILKTLYSKSGSADVLQAAANTSELIISLIDRMRISMSEEESRIVLGDRYRDLYLTALNDFEALYSRANERRFLEKIFEYVERCKAAGLLAATREMNALQFHIPPDLADLEKKVQREIGYLNSKISDENEKPSPDKTILSELNGSLISSIETRDSLITTFERNFPGYYTLKYNIDAPSLNDIPSIVGRNTNYLNYVVSDSLIYLFLANRRYQMFFVQPVDSGFFSLLKKFRLLLTNPSVDSEARAEFNEYQEIGNRLYKKLIEPARKYFISGNLLVSPDNLLSYIPFEVLLTSKSDNDRILYRELNYLMDEFDISYTYSATFVKEISNRKGDRNRSLVAFAPVYSDKTDIDSLFGKRQARNRFLYDLQYSREEAQYVASVGNGIKFLGNEAKESQFKNVAGNYGIIHLAMHTVLSDLNPLNSAMVFTLNNDSPEDGLLYTYEVYGIPLKARMVVLSSCNTGSGILATGEGILSLARGFMYSGSQSVVMSMWEVDDKSGTEVVKKFYDNLKKGLSKSKSFKKARMDYLKNASQLRSHPYFWSSLVVYGENEPVFFSGWLIFMSGAILVAGSCLAGIYFWRRKNS